jgi:dinuclear metal center YbgI/SA1388 family protein
VSELAEIIRYLDTLLEPSIYSDVAMNGLQVDSGRSTIKRLAVAVDSGLSVIEEAIRFKADLLIVHHGMFWGEPLAVRGAHALKLRHLLTGGCSLYASHLPLDGNREAGNGFELGRYLELSDLAPFYQYKGATIGAQGRFSKPLKIDEIAAKCRNMTGASDPLVLPFGVPDISTVGIITGSGASALEYCAHNRIDLLISGEPKHSAFHDARELGINAIFAGHYATETFGVRALARRLEKQFNLESVFIDIPSGI